MSDPSNLEFHDELWDDIPPYAFMALGTRGIEEISLRQCFHPACGASNPDTVHVLTSEEVHESLPTKKGEIMKEKFHIYCETCRKKFVLILEKHLMNHSVNENAKQDADVFMERVYALDENGTDFGEIGWVQSKR